MLIAGVNGHIKRNVEKFGGKQNKFFCWSMWQMCGQLFHKQFINTWIPTEMTGKFVKQR